MDHVSTKSIRWTTLLCWVPTPHEELVETALLIGQRAQGQFHRRITEPLWSARNSRWTASRVTGLNHSNVCDEQLHGYFDGARLRSSEFAVSCQHCGIAHAHVTTPRTRHHSMHRTERWSGTCSIFVQTFKSSAPSKKFIQCALSARDRATMHAHSKWSVPSVKRAMRYIYTVLNLECWKCAKWNSTAQLRTLEGSLFKRLN